MFTENSSVNDDTYYNAPVSTGTTLMAAEFDGGVVIGADSRTSMGIFVADRFADKLTQVTDNIFVLRSGSSADTQTITDVVKYYLSVYEMESDEVPLVSVAANTFKSMCYKYRDQLSAGLIVAGWDKRLGGQVYSLPSGGMLIRQPCSLGGSGSGYLYGYVDLNYKENMPKEDCVNLVVNAISMAIARDGSSGGLVRLSIITKDGIEKRCIEADQQTKFKEF